MSDSHFYVTTPIYYVNDVPHIGHAYTTVAADVLARFWRLHGKKVFFLTGTDEHGQKIETAAKEKGETPIQLADRVVERFKRLWRNDESPHQCLNISYDDFIRTTEKRHKDRVVAFFRQVEGLSIDGKKIIFKDQYEGWYCTPCETFLTQTQLVEGKCPNCAREVKKLKEESYFFRLSSYQNFLLAHYRAHPKCVLPESRLNETRSFVESGLKDLSLSRTSFAWGIPVPGDESHVIYVWFDALFNYISALESKVLDLEDFKKFWANAHHLVGKDILRFHAVFWPAFLSATGFSPPKQVFAHGWWTHDGKKMSKSLGNVVDPYAMIAQYGADAFRYFLLAEVPFGQDGDFSIVAMERRINADLANNLGNLFSRSINLILKQRNGVVPEPERSLFGKEGFVHDVVRWVEGDAHGKPAFDLIRSYMDEKKFFESLHFIFSFLDLVNNLVDKTKPWEKDRDVKEIDTILYTLVESLRLIALMVYPYMPTKSQELWAGLGLKGNLNEFRDLAERFQWGLYPAGTALEKPQSLFPRIEKKKA